MTSKITSKIKIKKKNQTFADVVFCTITADAPMFGRWPLCHHSTNALEMKMEE